MLSVAMELWYKMGCTDIISALSAYMAKVPSGQTAADFDGSGKVWFKVFQDMPTTSGGQYTWPSNGTSPLPPSTVNLFHKHSYLP